MGSIQRIVYFADLDNDVDTANFPEPDDDASATSIEDMAKITGDIPLKDGKRFKKLYVTMETGAVRDNQIGEWDGKSFENYLDFLHPGNRAEALAFARKINNGNFIFLAKDAEGYTRLIGKPQFPAKVDTNEGTTGQAVADRKGMTVTVKAYNNSPAPVYEGNIPLTAVGSGSGSV